jgi:hypothetical protein
MSIVGKHARVLLVVFHRRHFLRPKKQTTCVIHLHPEYRNVSICPPLISRDSSTGPPRLQPFWDVLMRPFLICCYVSGKALAMATETKSYVSCNLRFLFKRLFLDCSLSQSAAREVRAWADVDRYFYSLSPHLFLKNKE